MLSNVQTSSRTFNSRRPDSGKERPLLQPDTALHSAPQPVTASAFQVAIDSEGWEYIDVMLSKMKMD